MRRAGTSGRMGRFFNAPRHCLRTGHRSIPPPPPDATMKRNAPKIELHLLWDSGFWRH